MPRTNAFDQRIPEPHISNRLLAFYCILLVCLFLYSSNEDYIEARTLECAKVGATYQPKHDLCVKEAINHATPEKN